MTEPANRRDQLLDAAVAVLGDQGLRALTHRAVDAAAGVPAGTASNYFRTRDALLDGVAERVAVREREAWERVVETSRPGTPVALAAVLARVARRRTGPDRTVTLARYAVLVEAARRPELRSRLGPDGIGAGSLGGGTDRWLTEAARAAGSADPDHDLHVVGNYLAGLVLHQLAVGDPGFAPERWLTALLSGLIPQGAPVAVVRGRSSPSRRSPAAGAAAPAPAGRAGSTTPPGSRGTRPATGR